MGRLILALLIAAIFAVMVSSPVSAQVPVPAVEACSNAIPRAQAVGVTLPFNLCINLP